MPHDQCSECGKDYTLSPERDMIHLYRDSSYNFVSLLCPHCGHKDMGLLSWTGMLALMSDSSLKTTFHEVLPDEVRSVVDKVKSPEQPAPSDVAADEPPFTEDVPRDWLFELYNSMRHFGGECGPKCLWCDLFALLLEMWSVAPPRPPNQALR